MGLAPGTRLGISHFRYRPRAVSSSRVLLRSQNTCVAEVGGARSAGSEHRVSWEEGGWAHFCSASVVMIEDFFGLNPTYKGCLAH
ncbi:hypothetical protein NDU88_005937 [Pleurodeles waltl]|uniref:Uncharacterized protein n=1 Tax=Pleurodeles waltl TaxID=8319 RepID=A0AAV7TDN2_PLEWA|nr:hypothetical protein NDU88_005937 [Pleurodeles waltl]